MQRTLLILAITSSLFLSACTVCAPVSGQPPAATPAEGGPASTGIVEAALDTLLDQLPTPGNGMRDAPGAVLLVDSPAGPLLEGGSQGGRVAYRRRPAQPSDCRGADGERRQPALVWSRRKLKLVHRLPLRPW